jgi:hypothetical protein
MSAYLTKDRIEEERLERAWLEDTTVERMTDELLDDPVLLASAISDMDEESTLTERLAEALYTVYHDSDCMAKPVMQLRAALYNVVKAHSKAVMENF